MVKKPQTKKSAARKKTQPAKAKPATTSAAAKAAVGHNSADPKLRELFLQHQQKINRLRELATSAAGKLRAAYKEAKTDKFTKAQFDVARQLSTPEGEAEFRVALSQTVAAAMYIGSDIGGQLGQLDLFAGSTTDATERAYDEGQKASIENRAAKPDYAPGTAQFESYMKGFHDHQAGISAGFKTTDTGAKPQTERNRRARANGAPAEKEPADKPAEQPIQPDQQEDPPAPPPAAAPTSGQPLSRAEYNRLQQAEVAGEQSQFSRRN